MQNFIIFHSITREVMYIIKTEDLATANNILFEKKGFRIENMQNISVTNQPPQINDPQKLIITERSEVLNGD